MKHLLLDVNVVVDLCVTRRGSTNSRLALAQAKKAGLTCWCYVGSVQTMEYVVADELFHQANAAGQPISRTLSKARARFILGQHTAHFQWLAALAGEADVFGTEDPEDEQLILALDRFPVNTVVLLTRDKLMSDRAGERAMTPEALIECQRAQAIQPAIDFIDLKTQQDAIRPELEKNIHRVLHHGQYIMGPEVKQLEDKLAAYVGAKHCITASSGTDTLLIAMMALGIGPGDEVITTPFTFIATGEMIALLGARPVFVDIDPRTYNIDPAKIEAAITPKTKAIMPVSLYGQCADMDAINEIANRHRLPVIEDAAQSFGATYKGRKSCALSTIGSTSFFPSKPLGGYGDGGALFTNDDALAKAMRDIRVHGQDRRYHHPRIGINGRLDTLQAAIVLAKMERFDWEVEQRQKVGAGYTAMLKESCPEIVVPFIEPYSTSVYAQYTIQVANRDDVAKRLNDSGIPTAVHYPVPLHQQPVFQALGYKKGACSIAEQAAENVLSFPMGPDLLESDVKQIVKNLNACIRLLSQLNQNEKSI